MITCQDILELHLDGVELIAGGKRSHKTCHMDLYGADPAF